MEEELRLHLELAEEEGRRRGGAPEDHARTARIRAGGAAQAMEAMRDQRGLPWLDDLGRDVRHGWRFLRRNPLFTSVAAGSLAVGLGANVAVFTVVDHMLLRPLPVSNPQELVYVTDQRSEQEPSPRFSYPFYTMVRDSGVLQGVAARYALLLNVSTAAPEFAVRLRGELISGSYFSVVGAGVQMGRALTPDDDRTPGAHPVAVVSERFWRRSLTSDPSAVGRDIRINGYPFTIVGVAAEGFTGTDVGSPTDFWLPMMMQREVGRDLLTDARTNWVEIIGRLTPGVRVERAEAVLTDFVARTEASDAPAGMESRRIVLLSGGRGNAPARRELGQALTVLWALTALALVMACVNVASLLAVRSASREKEVAVRLALGAERSHLVRQRLVETLMLAAMGGMAALLTAPWAAGLLVASQPDRLGIDPSLDLRVFMFGFALSILAGLLIGQAPILSSRKSELAPASRSSGTTPVRHFAPHDYIVAAQIATSLAMLISAALLVQSLRGLNSVDPGFRTDDLLLASIDPRAAGYDALRVEGLWRDMLDRIGGIDGVQSVSLARIAPLDTNSRQRQPVIDPASGETPEIDANFVGPEYFRTLGIPLASGRDFDSRDGKTSRPIVIVNERFARWFWPGQDPIGKGVQIKGGPSGSQMYEVIGVVKDAKYRELLSDTPPVLYQPVFQTSSTDPMTLHVRAEGDPNVLAAAIRRQIHDIDADLSLFGVVSLEDQLNASFVQTRQAAVLTGGFGILALLLSGVGVYGVTALMVSRQTHNIGIRMALGAQPRDIVRAIGGRSLKVVLMGLGSGVLGAWGVTRIAQALLYGVTASDAATFAGMSALLAVVSLAAIYIPARAACRLDAVSAMRRE